MKRFVLPPCPACNRILKRVDVDVAIVTVRRACKACGRAWSLTCTPRINPPGVILHWLDTSSPLHKKAGAAW